MSRNKQQKWQVWQNSQKGGEDSKISKGTPLPSYLNVVKAKDKFSPYFPFSPIGQNCHFQRAPLPCPWFIQLLTNKFQGLFKDFLRTK